MAGVSAIGGRIGAGESRGQRVGVCGGRAVEASTEAEPSRASSSTQSRRFGVGPRARSPGPLLVVKINRKSPVRSQACQRLA